MQVLNRSTLDHLPAGVAGPGYERAKVTAGIAHIGVGAFHRAHLAVYTDKILSRTASSDWGILGINLLPQDRPLADAFKAQDNLYSVTTMAPDGARSTQVLGVMVDYLYAPDDAAAVLERLADPAIKILSLTITEGGYLIDAEGRFRLDDETVVYDLAHPEAPRGVFGFIIGALARRRAAGVPPFTVMSCDNLRHNGDQARRACLAYAKAHDGELAAWIEAEVSFPNAMVDRITPATDAARRQQLNELSGLEDQVPVVCEDFIQWVLEDRFVQGRPAWEEVGVQIVDDVTPYEDVKIRLLNGSHQMLSYPAFLSGLRGVDVAMADPLFHDYLRDFLGKDASVWLHSLPGMELVSYQQKLLERFGNTAIADQLDRLCLDGGSKIPGFLRPTLDANLSHGKDIRRMAFLLACYDRYIKVGKDDNGESYPLREPNALALLQPIIDSPSPLTLLESEPLVGTLVGRDARFKAQYLAYHRHIAEHGARRTLELLDEVVAGIG